MRPGDVLAYRRLLHEATTDELRTLQQHGHSDEDEDFCIVLGECRDATSTTSETYYVSDDMTAVAAEAAKTMPRQTLLDGDLPAPRGFLVYDAPVGSLPRETGSIPEVQLRMGVEYPLPVIGFAWTVTGPWPTWDTEEDHAVNAPLDRSPDRHAFHVAIHPLSLNTGVYPPVHPVGQLGAGMSWEIGRAPLNDQANIARVILATWTLMQQTITTSERGTGGRAERRRCHRAGLPMDVVIYRLRRKLAEQSPPVEEGSVPWSHRWLVSGYWQNHYNPGTGYHRYMWISGHVKGPEHLPLVVKDRVHAWVR